MLPGDKLVIHNVIPGATSKKLCKLLWIKQNGILKNVKENRKKTQKIKNKQQTEKNGRQAISYQELH